MKGSASMGLAVCLVLCACSRKPTNEVSTGAPRASVIPSDSMTAWIAMLADTAVALHSSTADTAYYRAAVHQLLDTSVVVPEPWRYPGYTTEVASRFHVQPFNGSKAVWIEYGGDWLFGSNEIHCRIVNDQTKMEAERVFYGCHYHNGKLEIADLESDGTHELHYTLVEPVQSVPVISTYSEYYSLVKDSLVLRFAITTDERRTGVAFEPGKGEWITRAYKYDPREGTITVNERIYGFAPDDFSFEEEIKPKSLLNKSTYQLVYNTDSLRYVRVTG
jgi:hypothetical protein